MENDDVEVPQQEVKPRSKLALVRWMIQQGITDNTQIEEQAKKYGMNFKYNYIAMCKHVVGKENGQPPKRKSKKRGSYVKKLDATLNDVLSVQEMAKKLDLPISKVCEVLAATKQFDPIVLDACLNFLNK